MDEMESPTCVPTKSGEVIRVRVRPEDDTTKKLIEAVSTLSNDGKSFSVVVTGEEERN